MAFDSYFVRVYPPELPPENTPLVGAIPLINDLYVPAEPEGASEPERAPLRPWVVLVLLWYICHVSLIGASYIYLIQYPLEPADHVWQAIPLGWVVALALWAMTLFVRRRVRKETECALDRPYHSSTRRWWRFVAEQVITGMIRPGRAM